MASPQVVDRAPNASETFASPWLGQADAARYSRRSVRTINEALRCGELRGYQSKPGSGRKRGGTWVIHIDDLDAWIRGEEPPPRPTPIRRR